MTRNIRHARQWSCLVLILVACASCATGSDAVDSATEVATMMAVAPPTATTSPEVTAVETPTVEPVAELPTPVPAPSVAIPAPEATSATNPAATATVSTELQVVAPAAFQQPLSELGTAFGRANSGTVVVARYPDAGQRVDDVAADADVVFADDSATVDALVAAGRAVSETTRAIARDRLVVVVPPPETAIVRTLQDLGKPGVRVAVPSADVAAGAAVTTLLERAAGEAAFGDAFTTAVRTNLLPPEPDVAGVLRKVVFGEADAGILYSSEIVDVLAERTGRIPIPDALNTVRSMTLVPVGDVAAQQFADYFNTPEAQEILGRYGYEPVGDAPDIAAPEGLLEISGAVASIVTLTRADLEQYPQVDVPPSVTGGATGYRGPRLADLLSAAGASTSAQTVVFTSADGATSERPLEELLGRFDVLVALGHDGLQIIDPRVDQPIAVDNVVRIEVK